MEHITWRSLLRAIVARLGEASGQTLAEYGLLLAILAIVILAVALLVGSEISSLFVPVAHLL